MPGLYDADKSANSMAEQLRQSYVSQGNAPQAILLDFYGTVVEEDDAPIAQICQRIAEVSAIPALPAEIGARWGRIFADPCAESYGGCFRLLNALERCSLTCVLHEFECGLDPASLSEDLYAYWARPRLYPETREVLSRVSLPICLVSNADNAELQSALRYHGLRFGWIVTSEDCRAYKPRREMFERALSLLGLGPGQVLHVGDSLRSDVRGAKALGIPVLWINRKGKPVPYGADPPHYVASDLRGLSSLLEG